ncbi:hypothetical protein N7450_004209 [Penicillium hetheringtonii]|uniref:BZIP domain-containing protein n=1 Tax=Penicillium hetheringtonii TaxID=911720 RepID=A0AAD6GUW7_9EURO|nr:hypothetical protein N7450_004209 [Penicillium hetheringtonii]
MKKAFTFLPAFRTEKQDSQPGNATSALTKRREQLRKAQRTHRQRKDKYYKSLESEVLRLRTSEVALTLQVRDLRNHIEVLQGTVESLTQHCSDISPDRTMISKSNYHSANLDLSNIPSPAHLSNQNLDCGHLYNKNSANSPDEVIENPDIQEMVPLPHTTIAFPSARPSYDKKWSQDMSHAGMEFVLAYV